jgi:hypothetical protein
MLNRAERQSLWFTTKPRKATADCRLGYLAKAARREQPEQGLDTLVGGRAIPHWYSTVHTAHRT